jgi:hypothetical protein
MSRADKDFCASRRKVHHDCTAWLDSGENGQDGAGSALITVAVRPDFIMLWLNQVWEPNANAATDRLLPCQQIL